MMGTKPKLPRFTRKEKKIFLSNLIQTGGNATRAAEGLDVSLWAIYRWRKFDKKFCEDYHEALIIGGEVLVDEMARRGFEGYEKPVFHQGARVGVVREYSDGMLTKLAKARNKELFHDPKEIKVKTEIEASIHAKITPSIREKLDQELDGT